MSSPGAGTGTVKGARLALFIAGLAAAAFGVAILVWPTKAAVALTAIIAVYAVVAGVINVGAGLFSKELGAGGRIAHVLLGVLYALAGLYAFLSLERSAAFLALFLTVLVGVMWVMEGFVALFSLGTSASKLLTIIYAIISIGAGVTLLSSPLWGALFLWWFLALALIVLGLLNVVRALFGRKARRDG